MNNSHCCQTIGRFVSITSIIEKFTKFYFRLFSTVMAHFLRGQEISTPVILLLTHTLFAIVLSNWWFRKANHNYRAYPRELLSALLSATIRVVRGADWRYGNQDGGVGSIGTILFSPSAGIVRVRWDNGQIYDYRMGASGAYDLYFFAGRLPSKVWFWSSDMQSLYFTSFICNYYPEAIACFPFHGKQFNLWYGLTWKQRNLEIVCLELDCEPWQRSLIIDYHFFYFFYFYERSHAVWSASGC